MVGNSLVIRLPRRKNRLGGDLIERSCVCCLKEVSDVSEHIPSSLCPIHCIWEWISKNTLPGERIFRDSISFSATKWMHAALEARSIPNACRYALHSLRRGVMGVYPEKGEFKQFC